MEENRKPNNPGAFPQTDLQGNLYPGMTLRDYFAAKAMQSILNGIYSNNTRTLENIANSFELVSKNSYWFADEMLKQREL